MQNQKRCWGDGDSASENYHDYEWGQPLKTDDEFFERLTLEIFQAGLSWRTVLHKRESFRKAFQNFSVEKVSQFNERDVKNLLGDKSIIRNRLKIESAIHNAKVFLKLKKEFGSFENWLNQNNLLDKNTYKIFQKYFKFMGPEIVKMFLMSVGKIPAEHGKGCWKDSA